VNTLPDLHFDLKSSDPHLPPFTLTLHPADYILEFEIGRELECVVGISPDKDVIWTLGQVFLRSFYTVFDRDNDRIGFARIPKSSHLSPIHEQH